MYNAIFQAFIDIRNLSELLFQSPDIVDCAGATEIPLQQNRYSSNSINNRSNYNGNRVCDV